MLRNDLILRNTYHFGLPRPVTFLHVTDAHLSGWNGRDGERKRLRAAERRASFGKRSEMGEGYIRGFYDLLDNAAQDDTVDVIFNTGDTIDLVSYDTLNMLGEVKRRGSDKLIATPGSHEFSQYVGEAREDLAYKMQSFNAIQNRWPGNIDFCSRVVGGVNFVALDNSYYRVTERQLLLLKTEAAKGYPIVLGIHIPLYNPNYPAGDDGECYLAAKAAGKKPLPPLAVCGAPDEVTSLYTEHRQDEQHTDADTDRFVEYVDACPQIKLIVCGHLHCNAETATAGGKPMLITDLAGRSARKITIT